MERSRPHVILSAAVSIDGKIATRTGDSQLSSRQDVVRLHRLRSKADAILVGKNTVLRDDPLLTVRHVRGKNPTRIILDSQATILNRSKILQTCHMVPTIIAVSKSASRSNLARLAKLPIEVVVCGKNSVNLGTLLKKLLEREIQTVLVEGGGKVNWEFIQDRLFDELVITVSPFLIGGNDAVSFVGGTGFGRITESPNLRLKSVRRLKNHLVLNYTKV